MKNSKKLKLILEILICILIILIGIVGVYSKNTNMYKNRFPHDYTLGTDIAGTIVIQLSPDETVETVYYDKDGKQVDSSTVTEKNEKEYDKKENPINAKGNLTVSNYNASLEIMVKRLELLGADQYKLDLDEKTGVIFLSVEDDYLEDIEAFLQMEGRLQLIDSKTEDIILDYTDFKSAVSTYASLTLESRTYINLKLNNSGIEKINNINKENKESKVVVSFDGEKIAEVSYDNLLLDGKTLRVTTGTGLTKDTEINSQLNKDTIASKLATIGKMPVIYTITDEVFIENDLGNDINYIVLILVVVCTLLSLILVIKYRLKGLLGVLGFITNISIFLIIIRLTNIPLSLNSFGGMLGLIILNIILINNILKCIKNDEKAFTENIKDAYIKSLNSIVIMLIVLVVLAFSSMTVINTAGLVLFWGWIVTVFGNLIFTIPMLSIATNK